MGFPNEALNKIANTIRKQINFIAMKKYEYIKIYLIK